MGFYTKEEFNNVTDVGAAIMDSSCIILQPRGEEDFAKCIHKDVSSGIVAFAKFMIIEGDDIFTADIPPSLAAEIGFSGDQVFRYALNSVQKKHPFIFSNTNNGGYMLHTGKAFGAATILYDGALSYVANELDDDYYVFPETEDYLTIIRKSGISIPEARLHIPQKHLSNEIFVYYKDHDILRVVGSGDRNVVYLKKGVI